MSDEIIQQAVEVLLKHRDYVRRHDTDLDLWYVCRGCRVEIETSSLDVDDEFRSHQAQALADAGLLPDEPEWGVQNRDVPVEKEHVFRTRAAAELAQIITRANFPWPDEITLVSRNVTPWKDAS